MIYLDSAATTFQKPPAVARAMTEALASMSSPGRGGHPLAMRAADTAFRCRTELKPAVYLAYRKSAAALLVLVTQLLKAFYGVSFCDPESFRCGRCGKWASPYEHH